MICLINFFNSAYRAIFLIALLLSALAPKETVASTNPLIDLDIVRQGGAVARRSFLKCTALYNRGANLTFAFRSEKDGVETTEHTGRESTWEWSPKEPGTYRIKVSATDGAGLVLESDWSAPYQFGSPVDANSLYAVLPVDNLSGSKAPLKEIHTALVKILKTEGFQLLDAGILAAFMEKHRVRYTGGVDAELSKKFRDEIGVDGIFITSLETWQDGDPPRVSLLSRVVLSGDWPQIAWIDSTGLSGDESPGLLGLGRVRSAQRLLSTALSRLTRSFKLYLSGGSPTYRHDSANQEVILINAASSTADLGGAAIKRRQQPRFTFRSPGFDPAGHYAVAVVPFLNIDARKNAGEVVALHLVKQLQRYENIEVIEPGLVRRTLLKYRMVMAEGPSLAAADILTSKKMLGADLVFSGRVFDYQGELGNCKVDFSVQAFDGVNREIIWSSRSYATGNDGVYFFDYGRIASAHGLTSRMSKALVDILEE